MSKATVRKLLMSMPKEDIIDMVLEMYDACKEAKEYLEIYTNPNELAEKYKGLSLRSSIPQRNTTFNAILAIFRSNFSNFARKCTRMRA